MGAQQLGGLHALQHQLIKGTAVLQIVLRAYITRRKAMTLVQGLCLSMGPLLVSCSHR